MAYFPHVVCPVTITSPAPDYGLPANLRCGEKCPVLRPAQVMHFKCSRGHDFYASPRDVVPPEYSKRSPSPESHGGHA